MPVIRERRQDATTEKAVSCHEAHKSGTIIAKIDAQTPYTHKHATESNM